MSEPVLVVGDAAIFRDAEGLWIGDLEYGRGMLLDRRRGPHGLANGRYAHGGILPPGAVAARSPDAAVVVGAGVWLAVVEGRSDGFPVSFQDASGRVVRPPGPRGEPVQDATEECPACGGGAWEHRDRVAACARCGHEISMPSFYAPLGADVVVEPVEYRPRDNPPPGTVEFAVYAASGLAGPVRETWSLQDVRVMSVGVAHWESANRWLRVQTSIEDDWPGPPEVARQALSSVLSGGEDWPRLSEPALSIWIEARERERNVRAASSVPTTTPIAVDGEPVAFVLRRYGDVWAAAADRGPVRLLLTAQGIPAAGLGLVRFAA